MAKNSFMWSAIQIIVNRLTYSKIILVNHRTRQSKGGTIPMTVKQDFS